MKFTLSWLKDHLDTTASLQNITQTLTMIGLEVEQVTDQGAALAPFTVARILHAEPHPGADKLRVCRVQSDVGELQIVCGAPNARAGILVALAKEGAVIPANGMVIKKSSIRGVESNGMLCSAEELGLSGDSHGIIELPVTAQIGEPVARVLGLDDPLIDINVTPNRSDCLGVRGIACDLAAAGIGILKPLAALASVQEGPPSPITVTIEDNKVCPYFIGCTISGVKNGPSPDWLQQRLTAIGQRPISALVDITNYLTFDLGRPLHVYDAATLHGPIRVRTAQEGETLQALNGKEVLLPAGIPVIADAQAALSIAGIIGGTASSCTAATTDVFLEVALFDPVAIAQSGRTLAIDSDARYRFERGVDVAFAETGARRSIQLIQECCGGTASQLTYAGEPPTYQRTIMLHTSRIAALGGLVLPEETIESILTHLGFDVTSVHGGWQVSPPSWRSDIEGEADLVEEVLRIHGYNDIPATPLPKLPTIGKPALNLTQQRAQRARRHLAARGLLECCSWSFLPGAQAALFGGGKPELTLLNPINAELDSMRPNLLPNLLTAAKKNASRGLEDVALFETGLQFHDSSPHGQQLVAAGIRTGEMNEPHYADALFQQTPRAVDAFDAKADALSLLHTLGINKCDITTATPNWYHPGRSGALMLGKTVLGYFGELHPALLPAFELEGAVVGFEIFLDALPVPKHKSSARPALLLSDYQAVQRDFAFIMSQHVTSSALIKALAQADKQLITDITIFDVYAGPHVEPGKKSVAVRVTLRAADRTLSEQDIEHISAAIIAAAQKGVGGQLRQ